MAEEMARELGVAMGECPTCKAPLKQTVLPDGGVSSENCAKCNPAAMPKPEKASASVPREQGTTVVTKES